VLILAAPSLFSEGIAARLGQHPDQIDLSIVDSRDPQALVKSAQTRPEVVLFEANDRNVEGGCPLAQLMASDEPVRLIRLDPSHDQVYVVTSERVNVSEPLDLINMVLPPG
jgi:hypothetical protein